MFDRAILESNMNLITDTPVAHYTRIETLCHFLPDKSTGWASAWATPIQFLNDRMEMSLGLEVLSASVKSLPATYRRFRTIIDTLIDTGGSLETDAFQMSFSGNLDELGQWRGYASNGMGCSVVTDAKSVWAVADVAGWIIYDGSKQKKFARNILLAIKNETDNDLIEKYLIATACFMKQESFSAEKEFRLIRFPDINEVKFRGSSDRLVPYIDYLKIDNQGKTKILPLDRIIIGPSWQLSKMTREELKRNHVIQGIQRLLTARGLQRDVLLESSRIPYDPR